MSYGESDRKDYMRYLAVQKAAERSRQSIRDCGEPWPFCPQCGHDKFNDDNTKCLGCGQEFSEEGP